MPAENNDRLLEMLQRATSAEPSAESLDPETAALRHTWQALGDLLEAADRQALVRLLPPESPAHRRVWPALAAALAIAVLVGLTAWCFWPLRPERIPAEGTPAIAATQATSPLDRQGEPEFDWGSAIEADVAAAEQRLLDYGTDWSAVDAALFLVQAVDRTAADGERSAVDVSTSELPLW